MPAIVSRFDYVKYDSIALTKGATGKALCEGVDRFLTDRLLDDAALSKIDSRQKGEVYRYMALARTAVEEAFMYIGKALRDEQRFCRPESDNADVPERTAE